MARTNNLKNFLTDVGDAIREKTETTEPIQATEFDNKINDINTGINIDGIIEEYQVASGGNVNAGDFVKFVNGYRTITGTDTMINNEEKSGNSISAVALSEDRVLLACRNNNTDGYLYAMLLNINNTNITVVTTPLIGMYHNHSGDVVSVVKLSETKAMIVHSYDTDNYLYGIVCNVSNTSITTGNDTQLSDVKYSGAGISAVALTDSKVFIAHSYGANKYLYGMVCTISGTTITKGTDTQLSTEEKTGAGISAVTLTDSKVFIAHNFGSGIGYNHLYGMVCTISGTTITKGTDTQLSTANYTGTITSAIKVLNNKVFIAHNYNNNYADKDNYLYGIVCTISGTTITKGTDTQLSAIIHSGFGISIIPSSDTKVTIMHSYDTNYHLYAIVCDISNRSITIKNDIQLSTITYSGVRISATALDMNRTFIAHSYTTNYYLYAMIANIEEITEIAKLQNITGRIAGVSKMTGSAGEQIEIYMPKIQEV